MTREPGRVTLMGRGQSVGISEGDTADTVDRVAIVLVDMGVHVGIDAHVQIIRTTEGVTGVTATRRRR